MPNVIQSHTYKKFFVFVESQPLRQRTKNAYLRRIRLLADYFPKRSLKQISERQVFDYLLHLRDHDKLRPSTLNGALVALRMFYRDLLGIDWKLWREFTIRRDAPLPVVLTRSEVRCVLASVRENRFKAVLALIYHCGLRLGEAVVLRPTDIDSARGVVRIRDGKGGKAREVPICPAMVERLRTYWRFHQNRHWLFPAVGRFWKKRHLCLAEAMGQNEKPMSISSVQLTMRIVRAGCGIQKPFTCHSLRHSFATHLLEEGVSIRQVSEYLGHASLQSTLVYLHLTEISDNKGRQAQKRLFYNIIGKK